MQSSGKYPNISVALQAMLISVSASCPGITAVQQCKGQSAGSMMEKGQLRQGTQQTLHGWPEDIILRDTPWEPADFNIRS